MDTMELISKLMIAETERDNAKQALAELQVERDACGVTVSDLMTANMEWQRRFHAMRRALVDIKEQLEDCPQPTAANGYQGKGAQEWINTAYAIACDALDGED